jgi:hypothetical protein
MWLSSMEAGTLAVATVWVLHPSGVLAALVSSLLAPSAAAQYCSTGQLGLYTADIVRLLVFDQLQPLLQLQLHAAYLKAASAV